MLVKTVFRIDVGRKLREKWSGTHSKRAKKNFGQLVCNIYRLVDREQGLLNVCFSV